MAITLKDGDKAPEFKGVDQNGKEVSLSDFKGKKVILYFYPKDDTPGCTKEACNLRDNYSVLLEKGFAVLGVSPDNTAAHQKFINKYELPFPLLADTEKEVLKAYGAWGEKNMYGKISEGVLRSTFIIDENGVILKIFKKVQTDAHSEQIFKALGIVI
jgi:thioredoxin-dependent peroxiredoxin